MLEMKWLSFEDIDDLAQIQSRNKEGLGWQNYQFYRCINSSILSEGLYENGRMVGFIFTDPSVKSLSILYFAVDGVRQCEGFGKYMVSKSLQRLNPSRSIALARVPEKMMAPQLLLSKLGFICDGIFDQEYSFIFRDEWQSPPNKIIF